jgi:membrane dipeptidase
LDGCFGTEQTPRDLNTIFDLTRLPAVLAERGYSPTDVWTILCGNFLRKLGESLPEGSPRSFPQNL